MVVFITKFLFVKKCVCPQVVLFFHNVDASITTCAQDPVSVYPTLRTCMCQNRSWVTQPGANSVSVEHSNTHTRTHTTWSDFTLHLTQTESQGAISIWEYRRSTHTHAWQILETCVPNHKLIIIMYECQLLGEPPGVLSPLNRVLFSVQWSVKFFIYLKEKAIFPCKTWANMAEKFWGSWAK